MYTHPLLSLSTISMHPTLLHHNEIMSFHTLVSWDWRKEERENTPREARGIRELSQSRETKERLVHSMTTLVKYFNHTGINIICNYQQRGEECPNDLNGNKSSANVKRNIFAARAKPADADTGVEKEQPHLTALRGRKVYLCFHVHKVIHHY